MATTATAIAAGSEASEKTAGASDIVYQYMFGSFAAQLVPSLPLLDQVLQSRVQLQLVSALARYYDTEFSSKHVQRLPLDLVRSGPGARAVKLFQDVFTQTADSRNITQEAKVFLGESLSGGAQGIASHFIKSIVPGARLVLDASGIMESLATLYAVGRVFMCHFESGGTIWTLEVSLVKKQYAKEVQVGQKIVELRMKQAKT
jgi:hypothetical protein